MIRVLKEENTESCFNFTMGSFDGAEICELFGIHTLSLMLSKFDKEYAGWYRDDELILLRNMSNLKTDRIQKDMIENFINTGFKIEGQTNLNIVDVLDVTFYLLDGTFRSYKRSNDQLMYVNILLNHPSQIIKQLPTSVVYQAIVYQIIFQTRRLNVKRWTWKSVKKCGYKNASWIYTDKKDIKQKWNGSLNIMWFNLPLMRIFSPK